MKYLLIALMLLPTFTFADELHYDLNLGEIYRHSLGRSDKEAEQRMEERSEAEQDRVIQELREKAKKPKTKFDDKGNIWREYPSGLVIPLEKGKD